MSANLPYLGYNFGSPVQGSIIPQRLQNLCIRDYAKTKNLTVTFSVSEYADATQALMLMAQLIHLPTVGGLIFYSVMLLPQDPVRRRTVYRAILDSKRSAHFALEDLMFDSEASCEKIETIYRLSLDPRPYEVEAHLIFERKKL